LSIDFLNELENKVQALITALDNVRKENNQLREELKQNCNRISDIESENDQLKAELEMLKTDSQNQQDKLNITAERIQGLLAKLEMVQQ
jgi:archaellum component FlaC